MPNSIITQILSVFEDRDYMKTLKLKLESIKTQELALV
jgi:hypothetical protein